MSDDPRDMRPADEYLDDLELLDRVLASTPIASSIFFAGEPCGDWRMSNSDSPRTGAVFHLVLRGSPWMHDPGGLNRPRQLQAGDFIFLPRDAEHVLTGSSTPPPAANTRIEAVRTAEEDSSHIVLICGKVVLEPHAQRFLLAPLPDIVVMSADDAAVPAIVPAIISIMWDQVRSNDHPLSVTMNKLADVLIAQVLRFVVGKRLVSSGAFAGLADAHLRRGLVAVIDVPVQAWSVETLAGRASMSRSAFAARFLSIVGTSPLDFIREWRMRLAIGKLIGGSSVAAVAASVGYESEASFAKAFKRVIGTGPGAIRPH